MIWRKRARIRAKARKFFRIAVKKINTCSSYYHPNSATAVFKNSDNQITTGGSGIARLKLVSCKTVSIVFTQAVISAKPKKSFAILHTANSHVIGESLFCCNVLEPEFLSLCMTFHAHI